jgi:hypothetical protein
MIELHVALGVREDGSVVHIAEIDPATGRGLKCRCTCAACGDRLIARLGKVRQRHFAHATHHTCARSDESALHHFAKEVFESARRFWVPSAVFGWGSKQLQKLAAGVYEYISADVEKPHGDIIPDVTLNGTEGPALFVEIRVTHAVDDQKVAKLEAIGLACVEIDLRGVYFSLSKSFDREAIRHMILAQADGKVWAFLPGKKEYEAQLRKEEAAQAEQARQADLARAERDRIQAEESRQADMARAREERDRLRAEEEQRDSEEQARSAAVLKDPVWLKNCAALGIASDLIPPHLNIKVAGEVVFNCHRAIWQSLIFIPWVHNKKVSGDNTSIPVRFVAENLERFAGRLLNYRYLVGNRIGQRSPRLAEAIAEYFTGLTRYRFVVAEPGNASDPQWRWGFRIRTANNSVPGHRDLPPEFNDPRRYVRLENGVILDRETGRKAERRPDSD